MEHQEGDGFDFAPLSHPLNSRVIYDSDREAAAFELQLRPTQFDDMATLNDLAALVEVALSAYSTIPKKGSIAHIPDIVPVPHYLLMHPDLATLPLNDNLVLGIYARELTTDSLVSIALLKENGFKIMLIEVTELSPEVRVALQYCDAVGVNCCALGGPACCDLVVRLIERNAVTVAFGVDTEDIYENCLKLGVQYFQGRYMDEFSTLPMARPISGNKLVLARLLQELEDPTIPSSRIASLAIQDAAITYRILRLVESARTDRGTKVSTLEQAIAIVGTRTIARWAFLLLVEPVHGKPEEITRRLLVRARMCELMAEMLGLDRFEEFFIVGLLSQIHILLDTTPEHVLNDLPLSDSVRAALIDRTGHAGPILKAVEDYEANVESNTMFMDARYLELIQRHAFQWTTKTMLSLQNSQSPASSQNAKLSK